MSRDCPPNFYNSHSMCRRPRRKLDLQVQGAGRHNNGQGGPIYFSCVGGALQAVGDTAHHHNHHLSPSSKRISGTFPQTTEGRFPAKAGWQRVDTDGIPPMGPFQPQAAPKEDHNVLAAELLYGIHLALQGELLDTAEPPAASFLENLCKTPSSIPIGP